MKRIETSRALRPALYALALAGLVMGIILPDVAAKDATPQFRVRVLMAVPDNSGLDLWIDDIQLTNNAQYKALSGYSQRSEGNYQLSVYAAGKRTQASAYVYKRAFFFHSPKDYTIVLFGRQSDNSIDASVEIDRNALDGSNNARVRLGNYLPGTATLELATGGSNTVLGNARFGETDNYAAIATGVYTIVLYDGNGGTVTKMDGVALGPDTSVSVFALGLTAGTPAPTLLINTDAGTPPAQPAAAVTTTTAPSPSAAAPAPAAPTTSASAALRQALTPVPSVANTDAKAFYGATGHTLGGAFKAYWESHGGLVQFGYPISEEYQEVSLTDGKTYTTQYFERARFEYHPENKGTQYEVLQGLLGREMLKILGAG